MHPPSSQFAAERGGPLDIAGTAAGYGIGEGGHTSSPPGRGWLSVTSALQVLSGPSLLACVARVAVVALGSVVPTPPIVPPDDQRVPGIGGLDPAGPVPFRRARSPRGDDGPDPARPDAFAPGTVTVPARRDRTRLPRDGDGSGSARPDAFVPGR
ncbi:hypothetical protein SSTG_04468 [Streptomyces sp. e14]|nr:hypothetical protein SSTG_04468 [Streptomyces sp. e14]